MSQSKYILNLFLMSIMWTAASFTFYCLSFMNKYMEGSIFTNFYLEGIAGIVGNLIAVPLYLCLKIRWSFILAYIFSILFLTLLLVFQEQYVASSWITKFGSSPSPHPDDTIQDNEYHLQTLVPIIIFLVKVANNIVYLNVYQCSFSSEAIFPFYKRATSIGISNFIARCFTILAPIVAEAPRPAPVIVLLSINVIALIASAFLPNK